MIERRQVVKLLTIIFLAISTQTSIASSEYVLVVKILDDDDKAIVQRRNGDQYLIEKGIGCLSLFRYEGKIVVINSPGLFAGIGSHLIIPSLIMETLSCCHYLMQQGQPHSSRVYPFDIQVNDMPHTPQH